MTVSAGSYLRKNRHHIYYFRRWVPLDLGSTDGPPEICFGLRTRDLRVAERTGVRVWAATEACFERLPYMRKMLKKSDVIDVRADYSFTMNPDGGMVCAGGAT